MNQSRTILWIVTIAAVAAAVYFGSAKNPGQKNPPMPTGNAASAGNNPPPNAAQTPPAKTGPALAGSPPSVAAEIAEPISDALARVTKKLFGTYVTPQSSPVQPERFTGYHTGVDFETRPEEQNIDVPIFAACDGKLLMKKYAGGYGGVAVEACALNNNPVTVIYGHLRLSSVSPVVNQQLTAGQQIAVLGAGYSGETDGERKHLHFGIHKGPSVNILGYVQGQSDLSAWIDPLLVLK